MRSYASSLTALALSVAVIPAVPVYIARIAGKGGNSGENSSLAGSAVQPVILSEEDAEEDLGEEESIYGAPYRVLDAATGEITEVSVRDYVIGAVCAEMPASFCEEALKAQAAAAHTYAERQRLREKGSPTAELMGADFSNDTSKYQGYFTKDQARQYFGDSFEESYGKISAAADEVLPYIITYDDEPIISAFHSMSPGMTESAENAWGAPVSYLVPVDSSADRSAPRYIDELRYGREVLRHKLETAFPGIILGDDMTGWIRVTEVSPSGTVLSAEAGDRAVTGNELRAALTLRSACFDVRYEGDEAVFTTRGYGHGVGMSQYGANAMAEEGSTWREIIGHYYPDCSIQFVKLS